jgi:hypothetical protein
MQKARLDRAIREVGREVGMRKALYPGWVENGKLKQEAADAQQDSMLYAYEILRGIRSLLEGD